MRLPLRVALAPAAIAALALLALVSSLWTDSIEQAVVEGNRMLLYAAALALLVVLLRSDRGAVLAFGAFLVGAIAVAGWVLVGMLGDDRTLFLAGRLHEPLGYINGQASFFVLAFWPCVALAERRGERFAPALAGLGLAGATLFAGLAVLGQSRGAILAAALSLVVVLALLPGRLRRIVALLVCARLPGARDAGAARRLPRRRQRRPTAPAPPSPCCSPPRRPGRSGRCSSRSSSAAAPAACARGARSRSASPRSPC